MSVEEFKAPAGRVSVDGNVVGDELMDHSLWTLSLATVSQVASSDTFPSGDSCILCQTLGSRANEGVNMYGFSQYERMTAVIANQRVWHSVYLQGSGTVKLYVYEFNANGAIVNSAITDTITLSEVWQRVDKDLTVTVNGYVCFGVETATTQSAQIRINDVYINFGDSARSGANLAPNDIKGTGEDGTTSGFVPLKGNELISVDFDCDAIEATYSP